MALLETPRASDTFADEIFEDDDISSVPFQEELRLHLRAVQRKLDLLVDRVGVNALRPTPERAASVPLSGWLLPRTAENLERPERQGSRPGTKKSVSPHLDFVLPGCLSAGASRKAAAHAGSSECGRQPPEERESPGITAADLGQEGTSWASPSAEIREMASTCVGSPPQESNSGELSKGRGGSSRRTSNNLSAGDRGSADRVRIGRLRSGFDLREPEHMKPVRKVSMDPWGLTSVVSNLSDQNQGTWQRAQERWLWQIVHGTYFQLVSSAAIVLNVVIIGVIADARLQAGIASTQEAPWWDYIEMAFCIFFALELMLRVLAEKILFLCGPEWKWNLFDSLLVASSIFDSILNNISKSSGSNNGVTNVTTARILRFVRFIRIIRIARAMRVFHSLRIVVFAIFESMLSLVWCLLVVGLIIYMFAVFFLYGVTEHFHTIAMHGDSQGMVSDLLEYYGSVPTAVITLFMTISGGVDWKDTLGPLKAVHWVYEPFFIFYIFFMVIGVMNVVVGAFVAATAEISSRDRECLVKTEMSNLQAYSQKIRTFFHEADKDKSGLLSWTEFKSHLKVPKVSAYFRALELDVSQAHTLFKLLDNDGSNEVSMDEFLQGCMRLKGHAKSLEVNMLLYENARMMNKLTDFIKVFADKLLSAEEREDLLGRHTPGLHSRHNSPRMGSPSPSDLSAEVWALGN